MIQAIVYKSNTGFAQRYATLLGQQTGLRVLSIQEAKKQLPKESEIIFMGSIFASTINNLKKADLRYRVAAIAAVGMSFPSDNMMKELQQRNPIGERPLFYLQGGLDYSKLHGIKRWMLKMMSKSLAPKLADPKITELERQNLELMVHGGDRFSPEQLQPIISWVQSRNA